MNKVVVSEQGSAGRGHRAYLVGFGLSLLLTLAAYLSVNEGWADGWSLTYLLSGLAVTQLFVQLVCFLHLGRESRPHWNLQVLVFAAGVVVIIVFGSLWIMKNLSYGHRQLPASNDIIKDEGYRP